MASCVQRATRKGPATRARRSSSGRPIRERQRRHHQRLAEALFHVLRHAPRHGRQFEALGQQRQLASSPASATYAINYAAILNFIKNIGPNPFPSTMRSGRIVYYTSIPSINHTWRNAPAVESEPAVLEGLHRLVPGAARQLRRHLADAQRRQQRTGRLRARRFTGAR